VDDEAAVRAAHGAVLVVELKGATRARRPAGQEWALSHTIGSMSTGAPEPTPEEEDASLERREEEDAQRYPAHEDPERVIDPDEDA
jgi:hypothetical protein